MRTTRGNERNTERQDVRRPRRGSASTPWSLRTWGSTIGLWGQIPPRAPLIGDETPDFCHALSQLGAAGPWDLRRDQAAASARERIGAIRRGSAGSVVSGGP